MDDGQKGSLHLFTNQTNHSLRGLRERGNQCKTTNPRHYSQYIISRILLKGGRTLSTYPWEQSKLGRLSSHFLKHTTIIISRQYAKKVKIAGGVSDGRRVDTLEKPINNNAAKVCVWETAPATCQTQFPFKVSQRTRTDSCGRRARPPSTASYDLCICGNSICREKPTKYLFIYY